MDKKYYITTTLPYVNADPHIGFAMEIIRADTIARYKRTIGYDVFFNTGTDEHGLKIYRKAVESGRDPQEYCDELAAKFDNLKAALNLSYTNFIRTTDEKHKLAAQEFWKKCQDKGDIYKKNYKTKYCVGCELEKTDSDLVDGHCPIHPKMKVEIIEEENYFFRFSNYQQQLLDLYRNNSDFVVPSFRLHEIQSFVEMGLHDFSISRLKEKMPWGVDVPGDPDHVMYVWFDALVNYISAVKWPSNMETFEKWWPAVQIAGKDNLRQQCAIWQAMLLSADLPPSKQIFVQGFVNSGGQKMSKSLGNVIDPYQQVEKYGTDAVRYYLLREIPSYDDGDYSESRFKQLYNADLANNLGNLVARICKLGVSNDVTLPTHREGTTGELISKISVLLDQYRFDLALETIIQHVTLLNKYLDEHAPWKQSRDNATEIITDIIVGKEGLVSLREVADALAPFLPETAEEIQGRIGTEKLYEGAALFARIS